jgi:hypothetical protein
MTKSKWERAVYEFRRQLEMAKVHDGVRGERYEWLLMESEMISQG